MGKKRRLGKVLHYRGKPLRLLLEDLPDHGVGRLIIRGSFKQIEAEPTYMRILKVDMTPVEVKKKRNKLKKKYYEKMARKIRISVMVEKTYRGVTIPRPVNICTTSYLPDFLLVPKEEEHKYLNNSVQAFHKGHFLYTSSQKRRIKEMILAGVSPVEAKKIERAKVLRAELEEAKRRGITIKAKDWKVEMGDNYDEEDDEDENSSEDSQEFDAEEEDCETSVENKGVNAETTGPERIYNRHTNNAENKKEISDSNTVKPDKYHSKTWYEEEKFGDFTEDQMLRINNMMNKGMNADTAKQIEWERDMAFKSAAADEIQGKYSKRPHPSSQSTNESEKVKTKLAKTE